MIKQLTAFVAAAAMTFASLSPAAAGLFDERSAEGFRATCDAECYATKNTGGINATELTPYQIAWVNYWKADDNSGVIGGILWIRVGDEIISMSRQAVQNEGGNAKTYIEETVVNAIKAQLTAEIEGLTADLEEAQAEIDEYSADLAAMEAALSLITEDEAELAAALAAADEKLRAKITNVHAIALLDSVEGIYQNIVQLEGEISALNVEVEELEADLAEMTDKYENKTYTITIDGEEYVISEDQTITITHDVSVNINGVEVDTHGFVTDGDFNLQVGVNADGEITIDGLHEEEFGTVELEDGVNQSHVDAVQGQLDLANIQIDTLQSQLDAAVAKLTFNGVDYSDAGAAYTAGANDTASAVAYAFNQHFGEVVSGITTAQKIAKVASDAVADAIAAGEAIVDTLDTVANLEQLQEAAYFGDHDVVTDHDKNASSSVAHAYANNMVTWTISDLGYDDVVKTSSGAWAQIADVIEAAYDLGFDRGYDSGYEDGYVDGYKDGFEDGVNSVK